MLVEVLLKFLVGVVDVELLKPIHLKAKTHMSYTDLHLGCWYFRKQLPAKF